MRLAAHPLDAFRPTATAWFAAHLSTPSMAWPMIELSATERQQAKYALLRQAPAAWPATTAG